MTNKWKEPRQYSLVKAAPGANGRYDVPTYFTGAPYIYLGEIPNMPMHCVVVSLKGEILTACHISDFIELDKDEV